MYYSGVKYHIPVEIWITELYPNGAPRCYVRPTPDMMIKPGHTHVDADGLVYMHYLSAWRAHTHNLHDLVTFMGQLFGKDTPVYRRPANVPPPQPQPQPQPPMAQPMMQQPIATARPPPSYTQAVVQPPPPAARPAPRGPPETKKQTLIKHLTKKLQVDLENFYPKTRDKLDEHLEIQMKMDQGRETLKAGMASLERQKVQLAASLKAIEQREREVDEWMQANQSTTEAVPVDEVIQAANTYSDQMYRLSAESSAIEDTLYHLEKALQKETIELDVFLKVSQLPCCLSTSCTS